MKCTVLPLAQKERVFTGHRLGAEFVQREKQLRRGCLFAILPTALLQIITGHTEGASMNGRKGNQMAKNAKGKSLRCKQRHFELFDEKCSVLE